jgi:hypothetical protein
MDIHRIAELHTWSVTLLENKSKRVSGISVPFA